MVEHLTLTSNMKVSKFLLKMSCNFIKCVGKLKITRYSIVALNQEFQATTN